MTTAIPRSTKALNFAELAKLEARVQQAKEQFEALRKQLADRATDAVQNMHAFAAKYGAQPQLPTAVTPPAAPASPPRKRKARARRRAAVQYRDKSNPAHTWHGRGRAPQWLTQYEKQGGKRAELRV